MDKFKVEVISATENPQQVIWAAMHQDYCEDFVYDTKNKFPHEEKAGELIVKHLLSANRGHFGPIEHPQIVFNVGYFPHSMMQQIRTHRVGVSFDVQCLAGNTEVTFVNPSGSLRKIQIAELYDWWTNKENPRDCKKRLQKMALRVLNEETGFFEIGHIKEVMCSGVQPVYRVTLENQTTLDCTVNHRLFTSQGWQTMGDAVGLITDKNHQVIGINQECFIMCNGVTVAGNGLYREKNWLKHQLERGLNVQEMADLAECSIETIKKWVYIYGLSLNERPSGTNYNLELDFVQEYQQITEPINWKDKPKPQGGKLKAHPVKVIKVEYLGEELTYDLEVDGAWHNFVANGMVVHNSFRYTGNRIIQVATGEKNIEDVFYLRPVGNYTNRQGKHYFYSEKQRQEDLEWCLQACKLYQKRIEEGLSEEHARGIIPFDARQHFVMSCNMRSLMHILDLRWKKDAQLEAQKLCELLYVHFEKWSPAVAKWYWESRAQKARLSP